MLYDQQFDYIIGNTICKDTITTTIVGTDDNNILNVDHINNNSDAVSSSVHHFDAHNAIYDHLNFLVIINNLITDAKTKQLLKDEIIVNEIIHPLNTDQFIVKKNHLIVDENVVVVYENAYDKNAYDCGNDCGYDKCYNNVGPIFEIENADNDNEDTNNDLSFTTRSNDNEDDDDDSKFLLSGGDNKLDITSTDPNRINPTIDSGNKSCINLTIDGGNSSSDLGSTVSHYQFYVSSVETLIAPILIAQEKALVVLNLNCLIL